MKITSRQGEDLTYAMSLIHKVKSEVEETKNTTRLWKKLDDMEGTIDTILIESTIIKGRGE